MWSIPVGSFVGFANQLKSNFAGTDRAIHCIEKSPSDMEAWVIGRGKISFARIPNLHH